MMLYSRVASLLFCCFVLVHADSSITVPVSLDTVSADVSASYKSPPAPQEKKPDEVQEKSDTYAAPAEDTASASYAQVSPVSTGNLYYYYYPVAAYPIHESPPHYAPPKQGYGGSIQDSGSPDFSPLLFLLVPLLLLLFAIPFLALIGVNVNNGRSFGRSNSEIDEKFGSFAELQAEIDLLLAKYVSALDSDQCMDRIVCELGVKARGIPSKGLFFSVVEWLTPKDHRFFGKERLRLLKTAANRSDYTMDTCKRYVCHPPAIVKDGITQKDLDLRKKRRKQHKKENWQGMVQSMNA